MEQQNPMLLSPGMKLNGVYTVGRALGAGGFGVTYLVVDSATGQQLAVKEYLPASYVSRDNDTKHVRPSSKYNAEIFEHGLSVFDREAEMLRLFVGNPAVVQVLDSFKQNGTAYYVMEFLDGVTLKALAHSTGGKLPTALSLEVLYSVCATLTVVHERGLLHRDVSPDNIFVTRSGAIKLIDFGATRFFVGERSHSLSIVLKPGFAPPEQYSSKGNQGPWTDVYALAATFLYAASGMPLPDAPDRLVGAVLDDLFAAAALGGELECIIKKALELDYRNRYQTAAEFMHATGYTPTAAPSPIPVAPQPSPIVSETPCLLLARGDSQRDKWMLPANTDISIGRGTQSNIKIEDNGISRLHCVLSYNAQQRLFTLTDFSTNGTYLADGSRLPVNAPYTMQPGERFTLAENRFTWEVNVE